MLLLQIAEEVGFEADQVALVRSGRPLYVDDRHRRFAVHPFLFHLTNPQAQVCCEGLGIAVWGVVGRIVSAVLALQGGSRSSYQKLPPSATTSIICGGGGS